MIVEVKQNHIERGTRGYTSNPLSLAIMDALGYPAHSAARCYIHEGIASIVDSSNHVTNSVGVTMYLSLDRYLLPVRISNMFNTDPIGAGKFSVGTFEIIRIPIVSDVMYGPENHLKPYIYARV